MSKPLLFFRKTEIIIKRYTKQDNFKYLLVIGPSASYLIINLFIKCLIQILQ